MASGRSDDVAFTIVGSGRVGQALASMGSSRDAVVRRGEKIEGPPGPIVVTTRNDDLQAVIDATPSDRREDLVFIQNGMLQPFLDEQGLGQNTQVLVFFAVAKLGDAPQDGKTDTNPEGLTAAQGKHAEAFAARLAAWDLSCKVLGPEDYKKSMLEKLIWICAVMAVGAKHKCTVGEVESQHTDEVSSLIEELSGGGGKELGVTLDSGLVDRLLAYSRSVSSFPTAVKEFKWRNGWFHLQTEAAVAKGQADPYPLHTATLQAVGAL